MSFRRQAATDMGKVWSGHSTFRPMRHAEGDEPEEEEGEAHMDRTAASGLYGYTKGIQAEVDTGIRKLSRFAAKTAASLWAKDPKSAEFLSAHARKAGSLSAKALLKEMANLGPKIDKVASAPTPGLYGFRNKTAKDSLMACQAMREESGLVAYAMFQRKTGKVSDLIGYMEKHCDETSCPYTSMLLQAMPDMGPVMAKAAQDSGAGPAAHFFFDNPRKRVVREFAFTKAISNVPEVIPKVVKEYDALDKSKSELKKEVANTPETPKETIKTTPGSDEFSTLAKYIVFTEQEVHKMPNKVPEGHGDIEKSPDMSIVQDLVTEKYLQKKAHRSR